MNYMNIISTSSDIASLDLTNVLSILSIFFGIYVIITNNPILSVLFLIGLYFTISVYLISLGLYFIGLSYLLIYVGAVSMLFLFILMLINIRISELFTDNRNSIILALLTILCFSLSINNILPKTIYIYNIFNNDIITYISNIFSNVISIQLLTNMYDYSTWAYKYILEYNIVSLGAKSWDSIVVTMTHISSMGNILYTNLSILIFLISIILLLAMVGAIVVTISDKPINNGNNKSTHIKARA